jgi:hypothetical protein
MTSLNAEQSQAVHEAAGAPVHVIDPATQETYVLLRGDLYERIKAYLAAEEEFDPRDAYEAFGQVAGPAGWDDPAMDVYEQYRKPS